MQRPVAGGAVQAGVLKSEIPGALQRYPLEDYVEVEPPYQSSTGYQVDMVSFVLYASRLDRSRNLCSIWFKVRSKLLAEEERIRES